MTLRFSRRRWRRLLGGLVLAGLLMGPYLVGRQVSPPALPGQPPPVYSPALRRTENYRRTVHRWLARQRTLDSALVTALREPDLYALTQAAQRLLTQTDQLSQQVALTYPPASLVALRDQVQQAADGYYQAALALNHWVGEPTAATSTAVLEAVRGARAARVQAEHHPWLATTPAGETRPALPSLTPAAGPTPHALPGGWDD